MFVRACTAKSKYFEHPYVQSIGLLEPVVDLQIATNGYQNLQRRAHKSRCRQGRLRGGYLVVQGHTVYLLNATKGVRQTCRQQGTWALVPVQRTLQLVEVFLLKGVRSGDTKILVLPKQCC